MFQHYLKIAYRIFFKKKAYSLISLVGLVIAFSISFIILVFAYNEWRINKDYIYHNRIFRIISYDKIQDNRNALMSRDVATYIKSEIPEVAGVTRISRIRSQIIQDNESYEGYIIFVDPDFFNMFTNRSGLDSTLDLNKPNDVIISRSFADTHFSENNGYNTGLTLKIYNKMAEVNIADVKNVFDESSTIQADMIGSMELLMKYTDNPLLEWHPFYPTFILIDKNADATDIKLKLDHVDDQYFDGTSNTEFLIQPFNDFYLGSMNIGGHYYPTGDKKLILWMVSIGMLLLIVSSFNYTILSTANAITRQKEFGIRKTFGSGKMTFRMQAIGESVFMTLLALFFSIILTELLLPVTGYFLHKVYEYHFLRHWYLTGIFLMISIMTGLLSGSYLAFYISRLNPTLIMCPGSRNIRSIAISQYLLTGQIIVYVVLVSFSIVFLKQIHFFIQEDQGYQAKNLLVINLTRSNLDKLWDETRIPRIESFKSEIKKYPEITQACMVMNRFPFQDEDGLITGRLSTESNENYTLLGLFGDQDFLETFDFTLVEGRKPHPEDNREFLINEAAVRLLGLENPVGTVINVGKNEIVGVVRDFHMQSFRKKINPMYIGLNAPASGPYFNLVIRYLPGKDHEVLKISQSLVSELFEGYKVDYNFQEDLIKALYSKEKKVSGLIMYATMIILMISSTGLFAYSMFEAERRTKEIGIRKVNGATTGIIIYIMSKGFLRWIAVAYVIACPVSYLIIVQWLKNFAYKTEISWWIFALSGLMALLITLLTISYQSFKAARKNPVEALRYE